MKQIKKLLALLLAVLMLCGLPFAVRAEDTDTSEQSSTITLNSVKVMEHYSTYIIVQLQFSSPIHLVPGKIYLCNAYNTKGCGGGANEGHWQYSAGQDKYFTYVGDDAYTDTESGISYSSVVNVSFNKCTHELHTPLWQNENGCHSLPSSAVIRIVESNATGGDGVLDTACAYGPNNEQLAATQKVNATSDVTWLDVENFATFDKATIIGMTENTDGSREYDVQLTFSDYVHVNDAWNIYLDTTDKLTGSGVRASTEEADIVYIDPITVDNINYAKTVKVHFSPSATKMNQFNDSISAGEKLAVMLGEWQHDGVYDSSGTNRLNGQTDTCVCSDRYGRGIKFDFKGGSSTASPECSYVEATEINLVGAAYAGRETDRFVVDVTFSEPITILNMNDIWLRAAVEISKPSNEYTSSDYRCALREVTYLNDDDNDGYASRVRLKFKSNQESVIPEWPVNGAVVGFYEYNNAAKNGFVSASTISGLAGAPVAANYESAIIDVAYYSLGKVEASIGNTLYSELETALENAGENETVLLNMNVDASDLECLSVNADSVLDLNGYTLTTGNLNSLGNIVDGSNGEAVLKITDGQLFSVHKDNTAMTLYDAQAEGYRFFEYDVNSLMKEPDNNTKKFGVQIDFEQAKAYELLAASGNANTAVTMTININGTPYKHTFNSAILTEYAQKAGAKLGVESTTKVTLVLTVTGYADIPAGTTVTVNGVYASTTADGVAHDFAY